MGHANDVSWMRFHVTKVDWAKQEPVMTYAEHHVYLCKDLEPGHFYVDHINDHIVMGPATWRTLGHETSALFGILTDMAKGSSGMRFVSVESDGPMRDAAKKEAVAVGADVVRAKDALTIMTERCSRLIQQAAGLNKTPTELQLRIFYRELAELQQEYIVVEERIGRLRAMLELAGATIATAA